MIFQRVFSKHEFWSGPFLVYRGAFYALAFSWYKIFGYSCEQNKVNEVEVQEVESVIDYLRSESMNVKALKIYKVLKFDEVLEVVTVAELLKRSNLWKL